MASKERPAENASAEDWRKYAVAQGLDKDEAEGLSRTELIEQYPAEDDDEDDAKAGENPTIAAAAELDEEPETQGEAAMRSGATDLPPILRATAVHRAEIDPQK